MQIMTGESIFGTAGSNFDKSEVGFLTYHLSQGKTWMFVSAACILGLSILFMLVAAWKVNPMNTTTIRSSAGRKRKN